MTKNLLAIRAETQAKPAKPPTAKTKKAVVEHKSGERASVFIARVGHELVVPNIIVTEDSPLPQIQYGINNEFLELEKFERRIVNMLVAGYSAKHINKCTGMTRRKVIEWSTAYSDMIMEFRRRLNYAFRPVKSTSDLQDFWSGVVSSPYVPYEHRLKASLYLAKSMGVFTAVDIATRDRFEKDKLDGIDSLPKGDLKDIVTKLEKVHKND